MLLTNRQPSLARRSSSGSMDLLGSSLRLSGSNGKSLCRARTQQQARLTSQGSRPTTQAMASLKVEVQEVALEANERPTLPRSGHCGCPLPAGHEFDALVFGGYTETPGKHREVTNEAWVFSKAKGAWSPVQYASEKVPEPRITSQAVLVGNTVWLIGGWNSSKSGPSAFLGDTWTLDTNTWAWSEVTPQGESLLSGDPGTGVSRFQAVAVGTDILIHTHRTQHDILILHTGSSPPVLELVPVAGPGPSPRGLHSVVALGRSLYLYGGAPQQGRMLGDLWRLDLDSRQWRQLHPGAHPHVRCSAAAGALDGRHILYFGGAFYGASGGLEMLGDVLLLDVEAKDFRMPLVEGVLPCGRNAAAAIVLEGSGGQRELLVYGGWRAFVESYNDTHIFRLQA